MSSNDLDKTNMEESLIPKIQFEKRGGVCPVIVQETDTKEILMLGYANQEALDKTLSTGRATFWSTSRKAIWCKGETSGNTFKIDKILLDCDQDSLIYQVTFCFEIQNSNSNITKLKPSQMGACHTSIIENGEKRYRKSCFYREIKNKEKLDFL